MKSRYRILIVDDEENVRRMLTTAFALQGMKRTTPATVKRRCSALPTRRRTWC